MNMWFYKYLGKLSNLINKAILRFYRFDKGDVLDPIIEGLLREIIYKHPPEELKLHVRDLMNLGRQFGRKNNFICGHEGCKEKSCDSHEISKGIFLKKIATANNRVLMLAMDFKENPLKYKIESKNILGASTFPGYCEKCDSNLFKSIENGFTGFTEDFINRHAMRTLRKEIYYLESHLNKLNWGLSLFSNAEIATNEKLIKFQKLVNLRSHKLANYKNAYKEIWSMIDSGSESLYYRILDLPPKKLFFASMYDLSSPDDEYFPYIFIYLFYQEQKNVLFAATFKNEASIQVLDEIFPKDPSDILRIHRFLTEQKSRFVFSQDFIDSLDNVEHERLVYNPVFFEHDNLPIPNFLNNQFSSYSFPPNPGEMLQNREINNN
ncbi:hypothetical protein [Methylomagnum sp.]